MGLANNIKLEIDGNEVKDFIELTIRESVYESHYFELTCRRDTFETPGGFVIDKVKDFLGATFTCNLEMPSAKDRQSTDRHFFRGVVTQVKGAKSDLEQSNLIQIIGSSPDFLMKVKPGCQAFYSQSLQSIVTKVINNYPSNVVRPKIKPRHQVQMEWTVQYHESDYDFLKRLASRFGEWFFFDGNELYFGSPPSDKVTLTLGNDLSEFSFALKLNPQEFKVNSYNYIQAEKVSSGSNVARADSNLNSWGKIAYKASAKHLKIHSGPNYFDHINTVKATTDELKNVAEVEGARSALHTVGMQGNSFNPKLKPGIKAKIESDSDFGEYVITQVTHHFDSLMNYENTFTGLPVEAKMPDDVTPLSFPNAEPQLALVTNNNDPDKLGRIKVQFYWGENIESPWIRQAGPMAGQDSGFYFLPEVNDEVLVAFEGGDVERPYVLGSFYNGKNKPDSDAFNPKNMLKVITSTSKLRVKFDDDKKVLTLITPGGNQVIMDDTNKSILIKDSNNNEIKMEGNGISFDTKGNINMKASGKISIESQADINVQGMNIEQSANVGIKLKGNASAELSASGNTTLKGAMVMIN